MIQFDIPEIKITKEEAINILLNDACDKNSYYLSQLEESQSGMEYEDEDEWDEPDPDPESALEERDLVYDLLFTLAPEYKDPDKLAEAFSKIEDEVY